MKKIKKLQNLLLVKNYKGLIWFSQGGKWRLKPRFAERNTGMYCYCSANNLEEFLLLIKQINIILKNDKNSYKLLF